MTVIEDLIGNTGAWLSRGGKTDVIVSSRVRLARNVEGYPFPGWSAEDERMELCERLKQACRDLESLPKPVFIDMAVLDPVDRQVLIERRLISNELAGKSAGSGVMVSPDEHILIMINEEDHLRLQVINTGLKLRSVWRKADAIDTELSKKVEFAFSSRFGYLTACPTNIGTGLRTSVMLQLTGLRISNEVEQVVRGLDKLGLAVRGLEGEGTEAYGDMYQVSNQASLGDSEENIVERLRSFVDEVVRHERNARARLVEGKRPVLLDQVGRAIGILSNARVLSSQEAVDLLSVLKLGIEMDLVQRVSARKINEILLLTQPGHLQKIHGTALSPEKRDEMRAGLVRKRLKNAGLSS